MSSSEQQAAAGELARAVLAHLKGWTVDVPAEHWGVYLVHKTGARIFVSVNRYRLEGRAEFCGSAPKTRDGSSAYASSFRGGLGHHRITCDVKRPPEAIARDLERRLLPAFLADWDAANASVHKHDDADNELDQVADRLASVIGGRRSEERRKRLANGIAIYTSRPEVDRFVVHGERDTFDGHRHIGVELRLSDVSPTTAVEILRMIDEDRSALEQTKQLRDSRLPDEDAAAAEAPEREGSEVGADDVEDERAEGDGEHDRLSTSRRVSLRT